MRWAVILGEILFFSTSLCRRIDMAMLLAERKTYAFTFSGLASVFVVCEFQERILIRVANVLLIAEYSPEHID